MAGNKQTVEELDEAVKGAEIAVRVAVRARPLLAHEGVQGYKDCIKVLADSKQILLGKDRPFTFDHVFSTTSTQEEIYTTCVKPLVESCIAGYNATVLAYGQTGSGKTFTMGTANSSYVLEEELGVLPRAIRHLFECIEANKAKAEFLIRCSFVEIYNEEINDLLHPEGKQIAIREGASGEIVLAGVREEVVNSYDNMLRYLETGSVSRTTGSTLMNQQSSRSHAIFTIIVEQRLIGEEDAGGGTDYITAKFHLVDLAGSERAKRTGAVGVRFKESVQINCGLLALGNVISALGDDKKRMTHVPYRESKLTRMLQDSLGGNSRTCMIACISTADVNFEETLNTLKYANRARNIKNKPIINRDPQQALLAQMRSEIQALQMEILRHRAAAVGRSIAPANGPMMEQGMPQEPELPLGRDVHVVHERGLRAEQDCRRLKEELDASQANVQKLAEESLEVRSERDHYQMRLDELNVELTRLLEDIPRWEEAGEIGPTAKREVEELCGRLSSNGEAEARDTQGSGPPPRPASPRGKNRLSDSSGADGRRESQATGSGRLSRQNSKEKLQSPKQQSESVVSTSLASMRSSGSRNVINQYLRSIRDLEEKLAAKDRELKARDEALAEATEDLARDELIFAEKMKEIKAIKKLARDLTRAKEELLSQAERDAEAIALLKLELQHREVEVTRLRDDLRSGQANEGRPVEEKGGISREVAIPGTLSQRGSPEAKDGDNDEVEYQDDSSLSASLRPPVNSALEDDADEAQRLAALALEIQAEDDETECILAEKTAIEAEKRRVEELALVQQQDYQRQKAAMDKQLRDLAYNIRQKEGLIEQLARNEQEAKLLSQQYEARMLELEREVKAKEAEIDQLRHDLESIDNNLARGAEEKRRLREAYEEKVRRVQQQVLALRRQQRDNEKNKLERLKAKSDHKAQQLQAEVVRMRSQQDALRRKMEELADKYEEKNRAHIKDIVSLKKEAEVSQKKMRELESEKSKLNAILQRKSEEMAAAQRKLRELGADADASRLSHRDRIASYAAGRATPRTSRRVSGGGDSTATTPSATPRASRPGKAAGITAMEIKRHHAFLDKEMERMLRHKELAAQAAKQERKRQAVVGERDELGGEKAKLELKKMRAQQVLSKAVEEKGAAMARLRADSEQRLRQAREAEAVGQFKAADELRDQAAACQRQLEYEHYSRSRLEEKLRIQQYLPKEEEETLAAIEERLEVLDAEAEYLAAEVASAAKEAAEAGGAVEAVKGAVERLSAPEMKVLLRQYVQRCVDGRERERAAGAALREAQLEVAAKGRELQQVESSLRTKELDFDRRLTEEQKAHAAKVQFLLRQIKTSASIFPDRDTPEPSSQAASRRASTDRPQDTERSGEEKDERVQALIKDNFYFKQTNRELKRKLRDMMAALAAERQNLQDTSAQASDLQRVQQELENCKSVLQRAGLNYQVPATHLRELSNGDLEARMSSQIHGGLG